MNSVAEWLPGCYCNLLPGSGEALPSYLLRLARANGYSGIPSLLNAAGAEGLARIRGYTFKMRTDAGLLARLGRMAIGNPHLLADHAARELIKSKAYLLRGVDIDRDALMHERAQVCPQCLIEDGYVREELEFAPITACTRHQVRLIDECPACHHPLSWNRPHLMHCGHCGTDLREVVAEGVDSRLCEVVEDFAALAPFRLIAHHSTPTIVSWDIMFRLFKALSLTKQDWALANWLAKTVRLMSVQDRHAIITQLAQARRDGSYFLSDLQWKPISFLAPMNALPRPHMLARTAMDFLAEAWLPDELAEAMCSPQPLPHPPTGAELFKGRPPILRSVNEALAFLGCDQLTYEGLVARGILMGPIDIGYGYDIDDLLAAQEFLLKGLLTLPEFSSVVGVPLDWEDLSHSSLLHLWNPSNQSDLRLAVDDIRAIHQRLIANWSPNVEPENAVLLRDLAMKTERPFQTVSEAVMLAARGDLASFDWVPPYDWGSIIVSEQDANRMILNGRGQDPEKHS